MKISFPDYNSDSSALVKMYLNGELGEDPDMLDPLRFVLNCFVQPHYKHPNIYHSMYCLQ